MLNRFAAPKCQAPKRLAKTVAPKSATPKCYVPVSLNVALPLIHAFVSSEIDYCNLSSLGGIEHLERYMRVDFRFYGDIKMSSCITLQRVYAWSPSAMNLVLIMGGPVRKCPDNLWDISGFPAKEVLVLCLNMKLLLLCPRFRMQPSSLWIPPPEITFLEHFVFI